MAAGTMVPYSNPAGNNQTTPFGLNQGNNGAIIAPVPVNSPMAPGAAAAQNPLIPATSTLASTVNQQTGIVPSSTLSTPPVASVPTNTSESGGNTYAQGSNPGGFITNNLSNTNGNNNLYNQFTDIYGQGVGASLFSLLNNMSGTNSTALQEYEQSLAPQEATAEANIGSSLGASGVSANSSVNALAQANLQSQETSAIAGEAENLTLNQEQMTANILQGTEGAATKEVSTTPLSIFGDVMSQVGSDAATLFGGGGLSSLGSMFSGGGGGGYASPFGGGAGSVPTSTIDDSTAAPSAMSLFG